MHHRTVRGKNTALDQRNDKLQIELPPDLQKGRMPQTKASCRKSKTKTYRRSMEDQENTNDTCEKKRFRTKHRTDVQKRKENHGKPTIYERIL